MLKMFFSPQVKRSVIIITSKLAYKSCRVTKQLKTKGSRKLGNISEILKAHRNRPPPPPPPPPSPTRNAIPASTGKNSPKKQKLNPSLSLLFHPKTKGWLKYSANDCRLFQICKARWRCSNPLFSNFFCKYHPKKFGMT